MKMRVEELFHELADLPVEARIRYFTDHGVDEETRQDVEALLTFDSGASSFLLRDISVAASRALPQLEAKGWRCGPYRLLEVIGRGGMGTVYLAERVDGEVIQRLAVKLLPPGAGGAQRDRFLQERQILASLTHPNIARMLDAGHLDNRQPFLAMEFVDGKPIDVFASGFTVRQKIVLFLKICDAVGYLHRNLVVHRDLKPSNILVAADGEPKLLDFGIAKILDLATDFTITSMRMLTPDYASPEQVSGGQVSTVTDIYSLGAVLYRLLTGQPAHEFADHSPEVIARVVTSRESTRPSKWNPGLKGDLEVILLKALRKDPKERYATVEQFAEDLEAFLESRPIRARSGNTWYRARKFLRRYWVPVVAAALVIASLFVGLYAANRQRAIAQRHFQDVRQLANKLFDIDNQVSQLTGSTKARQLIVDTSLEYLRRLRGDLQGDPELAFEVSSAYMHVAEAEGVTLGPNLGQMDKAGRDLQIAEGLIQFALASQPANRTAMLRAAQIARDQMILAYHSGRHGEELALARKSAGWLKRFQARTSDKPEAPAILSTYANVACFYMLGNEFDEALKFCNRGSELARAFDRQTERGEFLSVSAQVLRYRGDLAEALKTAKEAVRLQDPGSGEVGLSQATSFVAALMEEGWVLGEDNAISLGRSDDAVAILEQAFRIADGFAHKDRNDQIFREQLALAGGSMADILRHSDPRRALAVYDHALRHMAEISDTQTRDVWLLAGSSYALRQLGRPNESRHQLDTAFARLEQLKLYPAEDTGFEADRVLHALADHEADIGNISRAIGVQEELLKRLMAGGAKPASLLNDAMSESRIWEALASLQRRAGRASLASTIDAQQLELWRHWGQKLPNNPFVLQQIAAKTGISTRAGLNPTGPLTH